MDNKQTETANIQRQILLGHLKRHGSFTTPQARYELDVPSPAPRVHELRHDYGCNIVTVMERAENPGGGFHRFAKYVLRPGRYGEEPKKELSGEMPC